MSSGRHPRIVGDDCGGYQIAFHLLNLVFRSPSAPAATARHREAMGNVRN
jgi:hypothetical protein